MTNYPITFAYYPDATSPYVAEATPPSGAPFCGTGPSLELAMMDLEDKIEDYLTGIEDDDGA